jgi:hypothetical protein
MTYQQAADLTARRTRRKLANNTYLTRDGEGVMRVRLHNTDIVTITPERHILTSGGWQTPTTKDRLNEYGPAGFRIWQERGQWYVSTAGNYDRANSLPFVDGLVIQDGKIVNPPPADTEQQTKDLHRQIKAYAKGYAAAFMAGQVAKPGPGDCFYCYMREVKTGAPLGEAAHNAEHLRSHMAERYYVPSLLTRVLELDEQRAGIVSGFSLMDRETIRQVWTIGGPVQGRQSWNDLTEKRLAAAITKYLRHTFGVVDATRTQY